MVGRRAKARPAHCRGLKDLDDMSIDNLATVAAGIELRGVSKRYGDSAGAPLAVDDVSFTIAPGTLTTLLGPSGCGKTTTLRMLAGLESPSAGSVFIGGRDVTLLGPAERNVSMVFQSYALFPHMNVVANVAYGLEVSGVGKREARERARAAMAGVGLTSFDARLPSELSGGQQQRVALARALVLEPAVLLFDEPLSNLDARLRRSMREEIRALQQRLGLTVAYVTHDQGEALAVSDRIVVMDRGRIAQAGTPDELYERPASEFVAGFMGEAMLFDATWRSDGAVQLGPIVVAVPGSQATPTAGSAVKLAVRPEAWRIGLAGEGELSGTVLKAAYLGSTREYTFVTALGEIFVVAAEASRTLRPGEAASLRLAGRGVAVVPAAATPGAD
jgi:iron(III) transport system ATP-binding protein